MSTTTAALLHPKIPRIQLPPSKSYVNRLLIMSALAGCLDTVWQSILDRWPVSALPDDVRCMYHSLQQIKKEREETEFINRIGQLNLGLSGSVLRFLVAYLSLTTSHSVAITGSPRLCERPLMPLVTALRAIGAKIEGKWENNLSMDSTLTIHPTEHKLHGGKLSGEVGRYSSQFISSLLLIAPYLSTALEISLIEDQPSRPYILQTVALMQQAGANIAQGGNSIVVYPSSYNAALLLRLAGQIESDWSAASYPYSWCAILPRARELYLPDLQAADLQGDLQIAELMRPLGVDTYYLEAGGVLLRRYPVQPLPIYTPQLAQTPDLVPSLVVTALMCQQPFRFDHLEHLRHKESDRLEQLAQTAQRLGYEVYQQGGCIYWQGKRAYEGCTYCIPTVEDHRLAMAWAPILCRETHITLDDPQVVCKSFPNFWQTLSILYPEISSTIS